MVAYSEMNEHEPDLSSLLRKMERASQELSKKIGEVQLALFLLTISISKFEIHDDESEAEYDRLQEVRQQLESEEQQLTQDLILLKKHYQLASTTQNFKNN